MDERTKFIGRLLSGEKMATPIAKGRSKLAFSVMFSERFQMPPKWEIIKPLGPGQIGWYLYIGVWLNFPSLIIL
jgi:hypothetical protein